MLVDGEVLEVKVKKKRDKESRVGLCALKRNPNSVYTVIGRQTRTQIEMCFVNLMVDVYRHSPLIAFIFSVKKS